MLYEKLKEYFVGDLIYEDTEILFVLESPHKQEVKNGYPVAGKSGNDMSKVLFDLDESFGKLIFERRITKIGIINVCNYPLQFSAYSDDLKTYKEMQFFEKLRQNPKPRKHDKLGINKTVSKIMDNFKSRLDSHKDKKIVLCGNFAQDAFDSVFHELSFDAILRVPHPSFNQWKRKSNTEIIKKLLEFVK